ncbi:hypothetical protein GTY76_11310 [Streptomyces sp. SID4951]|nr:hypothetical protein [Streptomyces sp. SID4951]
MSGLSDAARRTGHHDETGPFRGEGGRGPQRQVSGATDHFAPPLGGHQLHPHRPVRGGTPGVQHLIGSDDIERIEAVEQDDLSVHGQSSGETGPAPCRDHQRS